MVFGDEGLGLLQAVGADGELQLQRGLLGVGQEDYSGLVVRIGAQAAYGIEIQAGEYKENVSALLLDVLMPSFMAWARSRAMSMRFSTPLGGSP